MVEIPHGKRPGAAGQQGQQPHVHQPSVGTARLVEVRSSARWVGVTSSRLVCWQGKEKVKPSGSDTPFIPMYSRKSEMQWTMWSKSWMRKARRTSYHHSKELSWTSACLTCWRCGSTPKPTGLRTDQDAAQLHWGR